jgi:spore germination protein GerM
VIFWIVFLIIICGLFFISRDQIKKTLSETRFVERLTNSGALHKDIPPSVDEETEKPNVAIQPQPAPETKTAPKADPVKTQTTPKTDTAKTDAPKAESKTAPKADIVPKTEPAKTPPAATVSGQQPAAGQPVQPPAVKERSIYLTQVDQDGAILRTKVARQLPASDSPMLDSLNALLQGPNADERKKNLVSLIPQGSRILSATVRGNTAYISFSEEFQYNTYGVEGYAAQLKQVVWTATEFSNVKDVQILIEGRRIDYLGEGIWIGSPVGRDSI